MMDMTRDLAKVKNALNAENMVVWLDREDDGNLIKITRIIEASSKIQVETKRRGTRRDGKAEVIETFDLTPKMIFTIHERNKIW